MVERGIKIRWEERMDNRTLSPEALSVYRRKAVESVIKHGLSQRKACMIFGFSETSMCKYMREYKKIMSRAMNTRREEQGNGVEAK